MAADARRQETCRARIVLGGPWRFHIDQDDRGVDERWFSPGLDRGDWAQVWVSGAWEL